MAGEVQAINSKQVEFDGVKNKDDIVYKVKQILGKE